jgi:hypothetical protein
VPAEVADRAAVAPAAAAEGHPLREFSIVFPCAAASGQSLNLADDACDRLGLSG